MSGRSVATSFWRKHMDVLIVIGVILAWFLLTRYVLPKLGVPT